jgi:hypothetical protein
MTVKKLTNVGEAQAGNQVLGVLKKYKDEEFILLNNDNFQAVLLDVELLTAFMSTVDKTKTGYKDLEIILQQCIRQNLKMVLVYTSNSEIKM